MKGFKQQPQPSRKDTIRTLEAEIKNMQMALRISQMMTQQMMQNQQGVQQDLGRALGLINELQYKILAVQNLTGLDVTKLGALTDELRLKDFNEASDKEDIADGFTIGTTVQEDSTVILTSKTIAQDGKESTDGGIFRSRIKLAEAGVPDLIKAFTGREVGARAIVKLNGQDHEVELLGIRQPPKAEAVPQQGNA
jgi:hypothetical protein